MPTMNISLTPHLASFVEGEVESGRYASASELMRDGLRLLERERAVEAEKAAWLRAAVEEALDDVLAGNFSDQTVEEIAAEVLAGSAVRGPDCQDGTHGRPRP